jgi:hypothetical protein
MSIQEVREHPILWSGYGLFMLLLIIMPIVFATEQLAISSFRAGAADRFTTVMAYFALVVAFYLTFCVQSVEPVTSQRAIANTFNGIMIEGAGLVLQGAYWVPWYVAKEMVKAGQAEWFEVVVFLNANTWIITPAFVMIWLGIGLTMNVSMRTLMGERYQYWPLGWFLFVASCWIVGYQLPDIVGAIQ